MSTGPGLSFTQPMTPPKMTRASLRATEEFTVRTREFWLHNASPEDIGIEWHGEKRVIPAVDRVARKHPKMLAGDDRYKDVPHSIMVDGAYLPGTLIMRDLVSSSGAVLWSAEEAIREKLGIHPETGVYQGLYALRGLSVIPTDASSDEIRDIMADGRDRYVLWMERTDKITLQEWDAAISAHKAKKLPVPAPPQYVEDAARRLRDRATERNTTIAELLARDRNDESTKIVMGAAVEAGQATPVVEAQAAEIKELRESLKIMQEMMTGLVVKEQEREDKRREKAEKMEEALKANSSKTPKA